MSSIQIACLLLAVSPATCSWVKEEEFKAAGCGSADKVQIGYEWIDVCEKDGSKYAKEVCGNDKLTKTKYTDSACTSVDTSYTNEKNLTCAQDGNKWKVITCGAAPSSFVTYTKYSDSNCSTVVWSGKFAAGSCYLNKKDSWSGGSATWAAGSEKFVMEGVPSKTTGLKRLVYTTNDCTGNFTTDAYGSQCAAHGDGFFTTLGKMQTVQPVATTSVANNIGMFSHVVGFFCMAAVLKYF